MGRAEWLAAVALAAASCGYRPVYGAAAPDRLHVAIVGARVPDAWAAEEVASGMREELARAGALAPGEGFPRAAVEVLRLDRVSEGIAVGTSGPRARAIDVGVVARARIERGPDDAHEADTGDLRAATTLAVDERSDGMGEVGGPTLDSRAASFHESDARRAAARRLGRRLAARLLGLPAASDSTFESP